MDLGGNVPLGYVVKERKLLIDEAEAYEPFREALRDIGFDDSRIEQFARESACSPTILRRRLAQVEAVRVPTWATDNTVARALIPLIFVGAWDSSAEADKEILHCLTNGPYEDTERTIAQLQKTILRDRHPLALPAGPEGSNSPAAPRITANRLVP